MNNTIKTFKNMSLQKNNSSINNLINSINNNSLITKTKKLNILLDIDETLIYFIKKNLRPTSWDILSEKEKLKYNFIEYNGNIIIMRPHLDIFLKVLFQHFNVCLWTLSELEYAQWMANFFQKMLGGDKYKFKYVFGAEDENNNSFKGNTNIYHLNGSRKRHGNNKDLNWLWYDKVNDKGEKYFKNFSECNTILIDDLPNNALNPSNLKNSIKIEPFALFGEVKDRSDPYSDVSKDKTLLNVLKFLNKILKCKDICDDIEQNIFSDTNILKYKLEKYTENFVFKNKNIKSISIHNML